MVVRIRTGKSIRGALSYNERKVAKGEAKLLMLNGFPCEQHGLGFTEKLNRFRALNELNPKVKTNTLHLSLNFPPDEIISEDKMKLIARDYMERIGFSGQPFLVYQHLDARHPHVHIVTTTIKEDGSPIRLHNIGKEKSEPARKAIEISFGLIAAETRKLRKIPIPTVTDMLPAQYGKDEIKHAITSIVGDVIRNYKFTSLAEFNIVLRQMNIVADRGNVNSRMYQTGGLVYSLVDRDGARIGQSIKASEIYGAPTLKNLEKKFVANAVRKTATKSLVQQSVNSVLARSQTAVQFADLLSKRNINLHFDQDGLGIIKAVYFVDHRKKATYTHDELGIKLNDIYRLRASAIRPAKSPPKSDPLTNPFKNPAGDSHTILEFGTHSTYLLMQALLGPCQGIPGPSGASPRKKKKRKRPPL